VRAASSAYHFMKLLQVDSVSLQAPQRFVDLPGGRGFVASVDLRHHKCFAPIAIAQGFSDSRLALAVVVVPTVVEKINAIIQSGSHDSDAFGFLYQGAAKVMPPDTHDRDLFAGMPQGTPWDLAA